MARNQSKRLSPVKIEADENGFAALRSITAYTPINSRYALAALKAAHDDLQALRSAEAQAQAEAQAARNKAVAKEWEFHNLILSAKDQVIAQYGKDSNEVQSVGLKKKSEYSRPKTRAKK